MSQARLPGTATRRRKGTTEAALDRALVVARRHGIVLPEHGALVASARRCAQALDRVDPEARSYPDLLREYRMHQEALCLTPKASQARAAQDADDLGALIAGLAGGPE